MAEKIKVVPFGIAIGIVGALYAFFLGLAAWWFNWGTNLLNGIASLYIGYAPTLLGSLIGTLWGFMDGFIAGVVIAWIYNLLVK